MTNVVLRDMSELGPMNADDMRFQFGFAWLNMLTWKIKPNDPRIAIPQMRALKMQISPYIEFEKTPVKIDYCTEEQFSKLTDMSRFERKNMTDFMCGDVSNLEFLGT